MENFDKTYNIMKEYGKVLPNMQQSRDTDDLKSVSSDDSVVQKIK